MHKVFIYATPVVATIVAGYLAAIENDAWGWFLAAAILLLLISGAVVTEPRERGVRPAQPKTVRSGGRFA